MATSEDPNKSGCKPKMPLDTVPDKEIRIDGKRSTEKVTTKLQLKNPSKNKVAYKLSCNHPFVISFDKEIGFLDPGTAITVVVTRSPFDSDKYDSQGRSTNILLQHVAVSSKATCVKKIWANVIGVGISGKKRIHVKLVDDDRVLGESVREESGS